MRASLSCFVWVLVTAAAGIASTASAATLTVESLDSANVPQNTFSVGDTIVLKVTGDSQGGTDNAIYGPLFYDGAIAQGIAVSQSTMYAIQGGLTTGGLCEPSLPPSYQCAVVFDQTTGGAPALPSDPILTSTLTLIATAMGVSNVGSTEPLDFFNLYIYGLGNEEILHTFTVVPEPTTAALFGLVLLGLARLRRARA